MQPGQIIRSYEDRGFWAHFLYPVCLVQEFKPCPMRVVEDYICDCDAFHQHILKERVIWLKENKLKYRIDYTITAPSGEDSEEPSTYTLILEFRDKETSLAYRAVWETDALQG